MKFAYFDKDGRVTEAHNDDTRQGLPDGAVALTAAQFDNRFDLLLVAGNLTESPIVKPAPTLAELRQAKWELIKIERDRRSELGGYKVGTKWFHSDSPSKIKQLGLVMAGAGLPVGLQWKTMDGSFVAMTAVLAGQIFQAAMQSDVAIFTAAETHKAAMQASPATYNYLTGWPLGYGE